MKRILIAATAGFLALSGAASAMTSDALFESQLKTVAPNVDAASLTEAQVTAIEQALASSDSPAELRGYIYSIVNG